MYEKTHLQAPHIPLKVWNQVNVVDEEITRDVANWLGIIVRNEEEKRTNTYGIRR